VVGRRGARDKGGGRGGGCERGEPFPPSRRPLRLRRQLRSRHWTLSFGSEEEVAAMSVSRWWGDHDNDDGKEEVVEVDDNDETVTASGVGGKRKGGF
jgi:hypothetical protein